MTDLPPGFQIPTPKPSRKAPRPLGVSIASWVLVAAGAVRALGGLVVIAVATDTPKSLGGALLAFGLAELLTGFALLRMRPVFRPLGLLLALVGIVADVGFLVSGNRWEIVGVLAHAFAAYTLATSAEAFRQAG